MREGLHSPIVFACGREEGVPALGFGLAVHEGLVQG